MSMKTITEHAAELSGRWRLDQHEAQVLEAALTRVAVDQRVLCAARIACVDDEDQPVDEMLTEIQNVCLACPLPSEDARWLEAIAAQQDEE
jgi:hypothetical protein